MSKKQQISPDKLELNEAQLALAEQLSRLLGKKSSATVDRIQVIRDSFTLPANDYDLIAKLQERALESRVYATKSELLRAGLHALAKMNTDEFIAVLKTVEKLKPGRKKT